MTIRIGGLVSGIDTDSIIKEALKIHRTKIDTQIQKKQILEWKRESYRETNTKLLALRSAMSDLKLGSVYTAKTAECSDEKVLTATASADVENGTHFIKVNSLLSGVTRISTSELADYEDTLQEQFGLTAGTTISFTLKGKDEVSQTYSFDVDTKSINDVVNAINANAEDSGITVGYSAEGKRFIIATADKGEEAKIEVEADADNFLGDTLKLGITAGNTYTGTNASIDYDGATGLEFGANQFSLNGINFDLKKSGETVSLTINNNVDTAVEKIKSFIDAYNAVVENVSSKLNTRRELNSSRQIKYPPLTDEQRAEMSEDQIEKWETHAKKGIMSNESMLRSTLSTIRMTATNMLQDSVGVQTAAINLSSTDSINPYKSTLASQFGIYGTAEFSLEGKDGVKQSYSFDTTTQNIDDVVKAINKNTDSSGIKAYYSGTGFSLTTLDSGLDAKLVAEDSSCFLRNQLKLNLTSGVSMFSTGQINADQATLEDQFGITGNISFTLTGKDGVDTVYTFDTAIQSSADIAAAINANTSTSGIQADYSAGKGFSLTTADSGTTAEITAIDTDSFLRNHFKLNLTDNVTYKGIATSNLTNTYQGTQTSQLLNERESVRYMQYTSLSSIGIETGSYLASSSDNAKLYMTESTLRAALQDNPEEVMKLFNLQQTVISSEGKIVVNDVGIAYKMYNTAASCIEELNNKAGLEASLYDSSLLGKEIFAIEERIDALEERYTAMEDRYWKQFTAMEQAIQKLTVQGQYLQQKLGATDSSS